jgi:uncharacterized membrane protein
MGKQEMSERDYRKRLEADLARWEADGLITAPSGQAIRGTFRPVPEGVNIATVVAIVGGLLIAAAFLAFVAANWTEIPRPTRFGILLAGIAGAYLLGAWFDRSARPYLADLAAAVGSIAFGAAIALTGQMYHLGDDFAGGMMLLAVGALIAAVLTGSRGAFAVALVAACIWNGMRSFEMSDAHLPFVAFWLICAGLAVLWNAPVARHLVALAAIVWCVDTAIGIEESRVANPTFTYIAMVSFLLGGGLALASRGPEALRLFGLTLSNYAALALAISLAWVVAGIFSLGSRKLPVSIVVLGMAGPALALAASVIARRVGPAFVAVSIGLSLVVVSGEITTTRLDDPWLMYAFALVAMLCLVISGMLDDVRPRVVAGWIGLAATIAAITWAVQGSLLRRSAFLAVSGLAMAGLATLLGRLLPKERR